MQLRENKYTSTTDFHLRASRIKLKFDDSLLIEYSSNEDMRLEAQKKDSSNSKVIDKSAWKFIDFQL